MRDASGSYSGGLAVLAAACAGAGLLFVLLGPYRYGTEPAISLKDVPLPQDQPA
jgi:hypothetical protein